VSHVLNRIGAAGGGDGQMRSRGLSLAASDGYLAPPMRTLLPLILSAALAAGPALAADDAGDETARAKEAFSSGQRLYKGGKFAEAMGRFEEAYRLKPHPSILFNIGKCWEQLGEVARALRSFKDYLHAEPDAKDKQQVSDAIANLERKLREKGLQQVLIYAEPPNARIEVNGKDLGVSPASVELPTGTHNLAVKADGYEALERTFTMQLAKGSELSIVLVPKSAPPVAAASTGSDAPTRTTLAPEPAPAGTAATQVQQKKGRPFTFVAGGLAVAGLGTGIVLGIVSANTSTELRSRPHSRDEATTLVNTATTTAIGANVSYGVAGAAAITAIILFFVEGASSAPAAGAGAGADERGALLL
jgi:PEGA domain